MTPLASIQQYLDELADQLTVSPRRARRILAEVEDHLATAREDFIAGGMSADDAEATAMRQFGSPAVVARDFRRDGMLAWFPLLEALATPLVGLAAVGLIAIGLSGLLSLGIGTIAGKNYVAGDAPGVTYTASRCQEYLQIYPNAGDCESAALADHFDEVVGFRVIAGVLGLVGVGAYFAMRRVRHPASMPAAFAPTLATAAFAPAGIALTGLGVMQSISGGGGGGANVAAGVVALAFAAVFALRLVPILAPQVATE